jgi:hypothetical protein
MPLGASFSPIHHAQDTGAEVTASVLDVISPGACQTDPTFEPSICASEITAIPRNAAGSICPVRLLWLEPCREFREL